MDTPPLHRVADAIKTGYELMGSRWQNCEAETIACQVIANCHSNYCKYGNAITWQHKNVLRSSGNENGLRILLDDKCIILEPYEGILTAPDDTVCDEDGRPMVIRATPRLLEYAAVKCDVPIATEEATA